MLHFNWPSEWNRPFVASLEKNIENAIAAQMNKKTLSFIHGKPIVKELRLGGIPPRLALKHIHCLTPSRISLSVAFEYSGDASISLSGISLNLDTTIISPAGAGVGIGGGGGGGVVKGATGGNAKGSAREVSGSNGLAGGSSGVEGLATGGMAGSAATDERTSHMPFLLPFEITLSCIRLAGSVDIEITQTFVYGINYFSFQPARAESAENAVQQPENKADDVGPKASSKKRKNAAKSKTMPMSAVVQSLAFTAPSLSSMISTDRKRSALIREAENIQGSLGGGQVAGKRGDASAHAKAAVSSSVCPPPRGPSLPLSPSDHFLPSDSGDSEPMAYSQSHLGSGMAMGGTSSQLGGFLQRGPSPTYGHLVNNSVSMSSFRIGQASASSLGLGVGRGSRYPLLASPHIQVRGRVVGRGRGIIRRPDPEEARTGVVSRQQVPARHVVLASSSPSPPAPYPANVRMQGDGGGVDLFPAAGACTLSTDSPTTCGIHEVTNRKECLRSGKHPLLPRTSDENNQVLASVRNVLKGIGRLYFPFWAFLKPPTHRRDSSFSATQGNASTASAPQVTAVSESPQSLSTTNPRPQKIALNVKSFLDAYAFKKYACLSKGEKSEAGDPAVLTGGTRVRILFFTDPIKSFSLETNFTSIGVDKTLEHLVRTRALKPAIETLLANGLSFTV